MKRMPRALSAIALILTALAQPTSSQASSTVSPGWNLLETVAGSTMFFGEPFEGVPLGSFDFSGSIGVKNVGPTDTIIHRVGTATVPGPGNSATVATAIDAFQLRSMDPVSILGGPLGVYYVTLQSGRGGPVSAGTMTIDFGPEGDPHGTFSSSFDLYVDVRLGSLNGPILDSRLISIPDSGSAPWRHDPTGPIQIPEVNVDLGDGTGENDFWIEGIVSKKTPNGIIVSRSAGASVPESGSTIFMLSVAFAVIGWVKAAVGLRMRRFPQTA
jgi:hypothetical protein